MPTYTVHYSNAAGGPPIGDTLSVTTDGVEDAIRFAEQHFRPPSHQPSVGDVKGYSICDDRKHMVVPWREGDARPPGAAVGGRSGQG